VEQGLACASKVATVVVSDAGKETFSEASFGRRELTIKSANGHSYASCERAIQMIACGDYPIADLSTQPYRLDQAAEAIDAVAGLIDRAITFTSIVPEVN
jgi:threonine dehydrogenase-like Zn-dependent dehydrogenase